MDRLDILLKGSQIDDEIYQILRSVEKKMGKYDEDKKWRFLTHMSMALMRVKKGDNSLVVDKNIVTQLKNDKNYEQANELVDKWFGGFSKPIPIQEKYFAIMHTLDYLGGN